ncbi:MAG TPA: choice-of-anchor tandem repeat GloVer-containing protein [Rhizomicrobium sp.]|nr:choice-of-anchor tandem repeat GloVer-containing protein [Rhizomicrobium sp.]
MRAWALAGIVLALASPAEAKLRTLYSFCAESGCSDGREPSAGLAMAADGTLYGTTLFGGGAGNGVVFALTPNAAHTRYRYKRLHSFCAQAGCADGADAEGALIVDTSGALYGATMAGGANDGGVVYKLTPNARRTKWTYSVLYSFCALADCADGRLPQAALAYKGASYDGSSPLYGTASLAGPNKQGVAFKLTPGTPLWSLQVIHAFCSDANCADGTSPNAALTVDASGTVFGTAYSGGDTNMGTAFKIEGTSFTRLHSFCSSAHCGDGAFPADALRLDDQGNLFGTTFGGGKKSDGCTEIGVGGCGTAFMLAPGGSETVLHRFCLKTNCSDGGYPLAGLAHDASGTMFGATLYGGGNGDSPGAGTLFELGARFRTLYRFCAKADCADGTNPEGDLLVDTDGNLFGTTLFKGAHGDGGTVFELVR